MGVDANRVDLLALARQRWPQIGPATQVLQLVGGCYAAQVMGDCESDPEKVVLFKTTFGPNTYHIGYAPQHDILIVADG